jgi:ABC-type nitrate/sulfonate/bicarbonate transport system substrate-binding protein
VTVLPLGGPSVRVAALLGGRVDATLEQQPDTGELLAHGFRVLLDVTAVARDYPNTSFATSRRYLRQHPDRVRQFLMAVATSIAEYRRHPDRAQAHIVSFLGVKDPALARVAYDAYIDVYPRDLRPSLGGLALVLDELRRTEPRAASFRPEQLVDTSALDALDRDGFFRRLH